MSYRILPVWFSAAVGVGLLQVGVAVAEVADAFPQPFDTEKATDVRMTAEEAAAGIVLPPGFRAEVFAAEPDVRQPIAMTTDARGRLWVAENYTYAERPLRWESRLRDRIVIFEDRNGDGRAEAGKVFWDEGRQLTSVEVGFGGVWALCPPQLLFIPDRNGDDVPDGPPEVVLDGFAEGAAIGHNIANGLKWGPDGWLYGRQGILNTSAVGVPGAAPAQRVSFNCALWRYHPTRRVVEVVSHGGTNPWGLDWDQHGQMFYTNTVIGHLWHVIPGAYYRRMFGTHLNPHVYEVIEQAADHYHWNVGAEKWSDVKKGPLSALTDQKGGGHVHVGCLIYQGGTWPARYHNALLTCNLQGRRVNVDTLHREGAGYTGRHAPDLLRVPDLWFRGTELIAGPDGNVYIADWSDAGECHDNDGVHRSSGRIYKISYGSAAAGSPATDLSAHSSLELAALVSHANDWHPRAARRLLQERAAAGEDLREVRARLERILFSDAAVVIRLRALWCWSAAGGGAPDALLRLLEDPSEHVRVWALRLLTERAGGPDSGLAGRLAELAATDASGLVRAFLAAALQRLPPQQRWPLARALAARAEDHGDRQQPLMIWYGVESAVLGAPEQAIELALRSRLPLVRRHVARRLTGEIERQPEAVNRLVAALAANEATLDLRTDIFTGMVAALRGWSRAARPAGWEEMVRVLEREQVPPELRALERELSLVFGSGRAQAELLAMVRNVAEAPEARRNALESLARNPRPEFLPLFMESAKERDLFRPAVRALARYDDPAIPALLLDHYERAGVTGQPDIINTLVARPAFARVLLQRVADGRMPRHALSPYHARQIRSFGDANLTQTLGEVWGALRDTPAAKHAELARWRQRLTPAVLAAGDLAAGRRIQAERCGSCHKLHGEGGDLGPDLTGSDRHNLEYLLENILDPGAVVPADYRMAVVKLADGRVLTGTLDEQNDRLVILQTPAERLQVDRDKVLAIEHLPLSLMPEGLLQSLSEDEVRDLFAYLMSHQTPDTAR